jgi:ParB/RepB/Spo0J family partition protein
MPSTKPPKKSSLELAAAATVDKLDRAHDGSDFEANSVLQHAHVRRTKRRDPRAGFIRLDLIDPDPDQPRSVRTDTEEFFGLVDSVRRHDVISPITVRYITATERYQIITGERRYRAAKAAGREEIPALVRDVDDTSRAVEQLVENLQREDMNPVEEARALHRLVATGKTQAEVAHELGKSKTYISRMMTILEELTTREQEELLKVAPAQLPGKSLILEALRAPDSKTRWAILTGQITRQEARASTRRAEVGGRPKHYSKKFLVPHATVTVTLKQSKADKQQLLAALEAATEEAHKLEL